MEYFVGEGVDAENLGEDLEFEEFNGFSLAFSPDSVETLETGGRFFLFQGFVSNGGDFDAGVEDDDEAELVSGIYRSDNESLRDLEGFYTVLVVGDDGLEVFRDVFGSKPVYFCERDGGFMLSSSIRPMLEFEPDLRQVNRDVARDYLKYGFVDHRRETFFEGVKRLKPSEKFYYDGSAEVEEMEFSDSHSGDLKEIVRSHIDDLRPSGDFYCPVSGGLDSTIVASECGDAEHIHATFTQGTEDDRFIDSVRQEYGFDTEDTEISPGDILEKVSHTIGFQEEPTAFPAFQAQALLYDGLEDGSVIMSGTGADELFYGYQWFIPFYLAEKIREKDFPGFFKSLISHRKEIRVHHVTKALKTVFTGSSKSIDLHSERVVRGEGDSPKISDPREAKRFHMEDFYFPHMLRSIEKQSEEFGIEVRHCFLSRELLSFSDEHGYEENFQNGLKKYLLRSEFSEQLPEKVYDRKQKTGFIWMTNELYTPETRKRFLETFRSDSFQNRELVRSRKALRSLEKGKMFFGTAYRLYVYEKWMQEFID